MTQTLAKQFYGIDKAMNDGLVLRAFRSGGGLRVVRIEDSNTQKADKDLKAYGEHPNLREALMLASIDYKAGGGTYETHYLTGTNNAEDGLDLWILRGHKIRAQKSGRNVKLEAVSWDYKQTIATVEEETFSQAYAHLSNMISDAHLRQADNF